MKTDAVFQEIGRPDNRMREFFTPLGMGQIEALGSDPRVSGGSDVIVDMSHLGWRITSEG